MSKTRYKARLSTNAKKASFLKLVNLAFIEDYIINKSNTNTISRKKK